MISFIIWYLIIGFVVSFTYWFTITSIANNQIIEGIILFFVPIGIILWPILVIGMIKQIINHIFFMP